MIKMIKITALLSVSALLLINLSCGTPEKSDKEYMFAGNGLIYYSDSVKLYTGVVSDTSQYILKYEVENGKKNGKFQAYLPDGTIVQSGFLIDNKNEGLWKYYYTNGNIESMGRFRNDAANGKWYFYFPDGTLKEEGNYINGLRQGEWKVYNEDGGLKNIYFFNDNNISGKFYIHS